MIILKTTKSRLSPTLQKIHFWKNKEKTVGNQGENHRPLPPKNNYRKENISVDGSKQGRDTRFWIHLKETWLNVFI